MTTRAATTAHRDRYPEQYTHPLCGKTVRIAVCAGEEIRGTVLRVVPSRFGALAILAEHGAACAWAVQDCEEIPT